MKSRISFCNVHALRKDITRFAPVWILYSVFLLLILMLCFDGNRAVRVAYSFSQSTRWLGIINIIYALITAQLLFGDLFNSRMTNALHAMPLRRETWFGTHVTAGLLFSLVPNLVMAVVLMIFSTTVSAMPWLWLLTATLQYLFFFSLAVFCALCVGSRFAMVVVYGLINFGSLLAWWLIDTMYIPLLNGVELDSELFLMLSPVVYATVNAPFGVTWEENQTELVPELFQNPEIWGYTAAVAVAGVIFGVLALVIYRRRHLETAGDFIATSWMKPVFLTLYTLMMGACCQWIMGLFSGIDWLFLIIGILVGWFTGQMLLLRTARVFTKRVLLGFAAFVTVLLASLGLTLLDPLDIEGYVPDPARVESVSINYEETDDPALIAAITRFHQAMLDNPDEDSPINVAAATDLIYTMKDGSKVHRYYHVPVQGTAHGVLKPVLSHEDFVLGDLPELWADRNFRIQVSDPDGAAIYLIQSRWDALLEAIRKDCAAGTMAQNGWFHGGWSDNDPMFSFYFSCYDNTTGNYRHYFINVYADSANTMEWLEQQNFYQDYLKNHP